MSGDDCLEAPSRILIARIARAEIELGRGPFLLLGHPHTHQPLDERTEAGALGWERIFASPARKPSWRWGSGSFFLFEPWAIRRKD